MAVEARHLNFFAPQLIGNSREIMNNLQGNASNFYNTAAQNQLAAAYGVMPIPTTVAAADTLPSHNNINYSPMTDAIHFNNNHLKTTTVKKSDSGITTYNNNNSAINQQTTAFSRKRSREPVKPLMSNHSPISYSTNCGGNSFSFLGEDISLQIHQHQYDIDRLISQHMDKVRMEIEDKRKRQARKILEAIEIGLAKRLRAKEEEIEKIGKLNWALEERVKSLCVENQIWRDLAQSNEATANALRTNLEQVLAQVKDDRHTDADEDDVIAATGGNDLADDAQSCCGENEVAPASGAAVSSGWRAVPERQSNRMCRSCGKGESCVLLLPCRHLCLCSACGSSLHTCPICKSTKNATVNVNMSS